MNIIPGLSISPLPFHNYSLPHFFLTRQRRFSYSSSQSERDLPPPCVLLPPLRLPSTVLTTRLFSRYTTFFQDHESPTGTLIFCSRRANCTKKLSNKLLSSIINFDQNRVVSHVDGSIKHQKSRRPPGGRGGFDYHLLNLRSTIFPHIIKVL